jgi:hypothetical protein
MTGKNRSTMLQRLEQQCRSYGKIKLRECLFPAFHHFFISFREIQKLDGLKSEKLKAPFHELLNFSFLGASSFCISQNLIEKSDEKLKQTPP